MSRQFFLDPELQRKLEIAQLIKQFNDAARALKNCPITANNFDDMVKKARLDVKTSDTLVKKAQLSECLMQSASVTALAEIVRRIPDALEHDNVVQAERLRESNKANLAALEKLNTKEFKHLLGMKDLMADYLSFMARFVQALYKAFPDYRAEQLLSIVLFVLPKGMQNERQTVENLMSWINYANMSTIEIGDSLRILEQQLNCQDSQLVNTCMPLRVEFINTHLKKMIEQSIKLFTCFVDEKQLPKGVKHCTDRNVALWKDVVNMQKY